MRPDFDELAGAGLEPDERERLRRAHELLLAAGPLPELPPHLAQPGKPPAAEVIPFFNRRRAAVTAIAAAAAVAAAFGGGYLTGHHGRGGFAAQHAVKMRGTASAPAGAVGAILVAAKDDAGNWPMLVKVSNLRALPNGGYYELWLTRSGKPAALCGVFTISGDKTEVRFSVPYKLKTFDGWIVRKGETGPVVLTTT